ncbi:MAG: HAD family hydrolase [Brachybacterium sp.]|nr:HAD family hydrolase [Brachybacterium sp.]
MNPGTPPDSAHDPVVRREALIRDFGPRLAAVALDVDGTLTDAQHRVSAANIAALRRLDEAGIPVVVVTGRALRTASATLEDAGIHGYVAGCNGAVIAHLPTGEIVREQPLEPDVTRAMIQLAEQEDLTCIVFTREAIHLNRSGPQGRHEQFMVAANTGVPVEVTDLNSIPAESVLKLMFAAEPARLDDVTPAVQDITSVWERSLDDWAETCHPQATKWAALRVILDALQIPAHLVAGAGDGGNDISWLTQIGLSAAMANARPELVAVTDIQLGHHLDDAAADFIDALLQYRQGSSSQRTEMD